MKNVFFLLLLLQISSAYAQDRTSQKLVPFRSGKLWGYTTPQKKVVIAPRFSEASVFGYSTNCCYYGDLAKVKLGSRYFLIDTKGKLQPEKILLDKDAKEDPPPQVEQLPDDVLQEDGTVTNNGQPLIVGGEYAWVRVKPGYNSYFVVQKGGSRGIIDRDDNIVLRIGYDSVDVFTLDEYYDSTKKQMQQPFIFVARGWNDSVYMFIRHQSTDTLRLQMMEYKPLSNYIAFSQRVKGKTLWGLLDHHLRMVVRPKYAAVLKEEEGLFLVKPVSQPAGYINAKGVEYFR